jgi:hypothetical protein
MPGKGGLTRAAVRRAGRTFLTFVADGIVKTSENATIHIGVHAIKVAMGMMCLVSLE